MFDLIHELFPNDFPQQDLTANYKAILIEKATLIIAISENTKRDIIKRYGIDKKDINVIYLAPSLSNLTPKKPECQLPKKYLLYVGLRNGYKNFESFIYASKKILLNDRELGIICTGHPLTFNEKQLFDNLEISAQLKYLFVNDCELKYLYQNAIAFVFPSKYEGFGIPILEAFACGCPALISSGSSMDEIGGDAAHYFNPFDQDSIAASINEVLKSSKRRKELIEKGYKQIKYFSWEKTVRETIITYKDVLKSY